MSNCNCESCIRRAAERTGAVECWYCGTPGCNCGSKRYDLMRDALEQIVTCEIDSTETPRQNLQWMRELAQAALQGKAYDLEPGDL